MNDITPHTLNPCACVPLTRRGQERRDALLQAADKLFLARGYTAVSLDELVSVVGGSKAAIYKYFGGKHGLLVAMVEYRCAKFFSDSEAPTQLGQQAVGEVLRAIATQIFRIFNLPDNIAFTRLVMQESQTDPDIAQLAYDAGPKRGLDLIARILTEAHQAGQIHCDRPFESAILFLGILRHSQWRLMVGLPALEPALEPKAFLDYSIDRFLAAHQVTS